MEQSKNVCPRCGKDISPPVLYQCVRCFAKYCLQCEGTQSGKNCPGCGMGSRMVLDQTKKTG